MSRRSSRNVASGQGGVAGSSTPVARKPLSLSLKKKLGCKVCGKTGHTAGFVGAVYVDCPNRPCYLCKLPGHTTMTCPFKSGSHASSSTNSGASPSPSKGRGNAVLGLVRGRELLGKKVKGQALGLYHRLPTRVDAAIIKLHGRRVTALEFHPGRDCITLSADKRGQLGIWNHEKVFDKTVHQVHSCFINNMRFMPGSPSGDAVLFTASGDGTMKKVDLEIGDGGLLLDLNPDGWAGPSTWRMIYGLDASGHRNALFAGDDRGYVHIVDPRTANGRSQSVTSVLLHKKGTKVVGTCAHPLHDSLLLTCGNDYQARLSDIRMMSGADASGAGPSSKGGNVGNNVGRGGGVDSSCVLASLAHPRVVNNAEFSPLSGSKILTTCQDNRLRVWDSVSANLAEPSREIVHSHDFNRYLSNFRAEWDPKDPNEDLFAIGRYISEDFDGTPLHPVDIFDASTGKLVAEVKDPNITTISPVVKLHPRQDVMVTGSSRSVFLWRPEDGDNEAGAEREPSGRLSGGREFQVYNACEGASKKKKGKQPSKGGKDFSDDGDDDDDDDEAEVEDLQSQRKKKKGAAPCDLSKFKYNKKK
eukprot:jgi/Mesvir1/25730/Mv01914-RA.1